MISQERLKIEVNLLFLLIGSHMCCVDWHNNGWSWMAVTASRAISAVRGFFVSNRRIKMLWWRWWWWSQNASRFQQHISTFRG